MRRSWREVTPVYRFKCISYLGYFLYKRKSWMKLAHLCLLHICAVLLCVTAFKMWPQTSYNLAAACSRALDIGYGKTGGTLKVVTDRPLADSRNSFQLINAHTFQPEFSRWSSDTSASFGSFGSQVPSAVIFALSSCSYKEFKTLLSITVTADIFLRNIAQPLNGLWQAQSNICSLR